MYTTPSPQIFYSKDVKEENLFLMLQQHLIIQNLLPHDLLSFTGHLCIYYIYILTLSPH